MKPKIIPCLLLTIAFHGHSAQALTPLPHENPEAICRQIAQIEDTSEALIKGVLGAKRVNNKAMKRYKQLNVQLGQLAFGWDTVVPFKADDLDKIAIAASNFVSIPQQGETDLFMSWGKSLVQEIHRLQADYGCT